MALFFPKKCWRKAEMQAEQAAGDASLCFWRGAVAVLYFCALGKRHKVQELTEQNGSASLLL